MAPPWDGEGVVHAYTSRAPSDRGVPEFLSDLSGAPTTTYARPMLISTMNALPGYAIDEANARGADAILAFRFDTAELGSTWTEICAYGTAVKVTRN
jgi:uncharacterized protein YbjQ (UPF0145 family)